MYEYRHFCCATSRPSVLAHSLSGQYNDSLRVNKLRWHYLQQFLPHLEAQKFIPPAKTLYAVCIIACCLVCLKCCIMISMSSSR